MAENYTKPGIAVLLAQKAGGAAKLDETSDAPDEPTNGAHMSAQDIIKAIHAKDAAALSQALKDHGAYCDDEGEVGGGSRSDERGDSGAAARDPNKGYSAFKK